MRNLEIGNHNTVLFLNYALDSGTFSLENSTLILPDIGPVKITKIKAL